jgi:type III secretion system low calcium response chaperone LcrH/SycD
MVANKNPFLDGIDLNDPRQAEAAAQILLSETQKNGKTLKESMNLSEDLVEEIYALAYNYYNQGKYEEAVSIFYLLVSLAPKEYRFILGLAATYHQMKDYSNAAYGFYMASWLKLEDPHPVYYVADCLLKLNQDKSALPFLNQAIQLAKKEPNYALLRERCTLIRDKINNNK